MRRSNFATVGASLAAAVATTMASSPLRAETVSERSYRQARAVLDAAVSAAGGAEALRSVRDIARIGRGSFLGKGQSLRPDGPYRKETVEVVTSADFERKWSVDESVVTIAGDVPRRRRVVVKGESGFTVALTRRVITPMSAGAVATARAALGRDPAIILLTALGRAETLRFLANSPLDGRPHRVIAFADGDGSHVTLYIDARRHLLSKVETMADDPVLGDVATEVLYSDHRKVGRIQVPFRVVTRTDEEVTDELTYSEIKINAGMPARLFEEPADAVRATPPPGEVVLTKLGRDVYFAAGTHNSLFVAFADHVLLVEAPHSADRTEAVLAKIRETVGRKPVRYVVPTHYHFDHSAGLRSAIATGATVVTTAGNRAFVKKLASTIHTIRPDALSRRPQTPAIEIVSGKRVFTDGVQTVELYDLGPTPHTDEMLVAYLPRERILFVSDLFNIPTHGPFPPPSATTLDFAAKLEKLGLPIDHLAPGHGRLGTMKDLADALQARGPTRK